MKKNICLTVIILSIIIVSSVSCAKQEETTTEGRQEATTTEGRQVILNKDGTWEYDEESAITKDKPEKKATPGECSDYVYEKVDEVTGREFISFMPVIVSEDGGKTGFSITGMFVIDMLGITIKAVGAGNCIDEGGKINILFRDGSRMELKHTGDFNCDAEAMVLLGEAAGKEIELKKLMTKEVKTMRVWTTDSYVQEDFTKQNSIDFMMSLKCLNEYIE